MFRKAIFTNGLDASSLSWSAIASHSTIPAECLHILMPYRAVNGQLCASAMQTARHNSYLLIRRRYRFVSIGRLNIAFPLGAPSVAGAARFELATYSLGGRCSIHLSYVPIYLRYRDAVRYINRPNGRGETLAEEKGFEPLTLSSHRFSRPAP